MGASQSHEENETVEEVVGVSSSPENKPPQAGGTRRRAKTLKARRSGVRKTRRQT